MKNTTEKINKAKKEIGKVKNFKVQDNNFDVKILDVRSSFGHIEYQIEPLQGSGKSWIRKFEK